MDQSDPSDKVALTPSSLRFPVLIHDGLAARVGSAALDTIRIVHCPRHQRGVLGVGRSRHLTWRTTAGLVSSRQRPNVAACPASSWATGALLTTHRGWPDTLCVPVCVGRCMRTCVRPYCHALSCERPGRNARHPRPAPRTRLRREPTRNDAPSVAHGRLQGHVGVEARSRADQTGCHATSVPRTKRHWHVLHVPAPTVAGQHTLRRAGVSIGTARVA